MAAVRTWLARSSVFTTHNSVHRSIIGDFGVTTPKQLERTLSKYSQGHPELQASKFVIPRVPGKIACSKRMKVFSRSC